MRAVRQQERTMTPWLVYAAAAALLYGLHQVFTKLAANRIGDGVGALVVEGTAALAILVYLAVLRFSGHWNQPVTRDGLAWSVLTGVCVGLGTVAFFLLFQRGGPLSAVPGILAVGAALMALVGLLVFREGVTFSRLLGIALSVCGLYLLRK
jgi:transporter family protein